MENKGRKNRYAHAYNKGGYKMKKLKNRFLHNVKDYKRIACIVLCAVMALMLIG